MEERRHDNLLDEQESMIQYPSWLPEESLHVDLSANWLNADQDMVMPEYFLEHKGTGFGASGSIGSVTGQKKNGKTLLETLFMAAVLLDGEPIGGLRYRLHDSRPQPKVLFIDTEQEESFSLMVQRRVHYLLGWEFRENNPRFRTLWLHDEEDHKTRWLKTRAAIWTYKPDFIVLDGCRDMVSDINEAVECTQYVRQTMKIATDMKCLLYQALHYNPGSEKMRGWLGTELGNRIAESWESSKSTEGSVETFKGTATDTRGKTPKPIEFFVDDSKCKFGIPTPVDAGAVLESLDAEVRSKDMADVRKKVDWMGAEEVSYTKLRETMKKKFGMGSSKANNYILDAVEYGILKQLDGNRFKLNLTADATEQTLPVSSSLDDDENEPF